MKVRYETPLGGYIIAEARQREGYVDATVIASECGVPVGALLSFDGTHASWQRTIEDLLAQPGWSKVGA